MEHESRPKSNAANISHWDWKSYIKCMRGRRDGFLLGKRKITIFFANWQKRRCPGASLFTPISTWETARGKEGGGRKIWLGYMDSYVKVILYILLCFASFYLICLFYHYCHWVNTFLNFDYCLVVKYWRAKRMFCCLPWFFCFDVRPSLLVWARGNKWIGRAAGWLCRIQTPVKYSYRLPAPIMVIKVAAWGFRDVQNILLLIVIPLANCWW